MLKLTFGSLLLRMAELGAEDEDEVVVVVERDEEKREPEEAAMPPEPRTKMELSSESANKAICKQYSTSCRPTCRLASYYD